MVCITIPLQKLLALSPNTYVLRRASGAAEGDPFRALLPACPSGLERHVSQRVYITRGLQKLSPHAAPGRICKLVPFHKPMKRSVQSLYNTFLLEDLNSNRDPLGFGGSRCPGGSPQLVHDPELHLEPFRDSFSSKCPVSTWGFPK